MNNGVEFTRAYVDHYYVRTQWLPQRSEADELHRCRLKRNTEAHWVSAKLSNLKKDQSALAPQKKFVLQ